MKSELTEHFDKVRSTASEVDRVISLHSYPNDVATVMVRGLLAALLEHHRSILQLLKSGAVNSSYALARDIVTGMRYGLWITSSATEEQIRRIETGDEFPLTIPEMVKGIEAAYGTDPFFDGLKNQWATKLYKYTRSDVVQLGRWHIGASSGLQWDNDEIRDVTT